MSRIALSVLDLHDTFGLVGLLSDEELAAEDDDAPPSSDPYGYRPGDAVVMAAGHLEDDCGPDEDVDGAIDEVRRPL